MQRPPILDAFEYASFRKVWAASFVSQLGDWMQIIGRGLLAYDLTGKASSVGIVYAATYAPQLVLGLWAGALADKFDRRRILIVATVFQALAAAAFGMLASSGAATVLTVSLLSVAMGFASSLMMPAYLALAPLVVPPSALTSAISLQSSTSALTRVVGPLLATLVAAQLGLPWLFWLNAISFSAVLVAWFTTRVHQEKTEGGAGFSAIAEAFAYVKRTPEVAVPILTIVVIMLFGNVYQPLTVVFTTEVLADGSKALGQTYFGYFQAAVGIGATIGILALARLGHLRPRLVLPMTTLVASMFLVLLGLQTTALPAIVVVGIAGAFQFASITICQNLVQHRVPDALRGRVMSIAMLGMMGSLPITSLVGAFLADAIGVGETLVLAGAVCVIYSIVLCVVLRQYLRADADEPDDPQLIAQLAYLIDEEG
ncbi:MAG: MFS transporter [Acidimicrobiia bacterium]